MREEVFVHKRAVALGMVSWESNVLVLEVVVISHAVRYRENGRLTMLKVTTF